MEEAQSHRNLSKYNECPPHNECPHQALEILFYKEFI